MEIVPLIDPYAIHQDGKDDLTSDWVISTKSITLTAGTLTAEQLTSTDDITAADTVTAGTLTDGSLSIADGAITVGLIAPVDNLDVIGGTTAVGIRTYEDATHYAQLVWDKTGDDALLRAVGGELSITSSYGVRLGSQTTNYINIASDGAMTIVGGAGIDGCASGQILAAYTHVSNDGTDHSLLGATAGTVSASKAVIVDASKDIDFGEGDITAAVTHLIGGFYHKDDADTYMGFGTDRITYTIGGLNFIDMKEITFPQSMIVFNEDGADVDIRMEAVGQANAFFLQGSSGYIGIGIAAPLARLHIDQSTNDAAIPVLILDQADISEGTINFIASARGAITGATDSIESVRVELGGTVYRLALYADA